jgi:serine/threonine-protein kinase
MPTFPRVGAYTIDAELGRGAMGVVYRARDPRLDRAVAIKALPPEFADDETRLARFEREARLMAGLSHPNIATVYGLEHSDSSRFLVMELVEGETLATRLSRGRLPLDEALGIAAQIATGVEAAHERGVVHRDLKPGNVMLQQDGVAKVLDFGLARGAAARTSKSRIGSPAISDIAATGEGFAVGTPGYMSPEQARGREVDRRTDIFAFGCILYECLTGRPAFHGESAADAIAATLEREPDLSLLPDRTPPRVRDLLGACLEKDPKHRLRDIGDARLELERAIERREWTSTGSMRAAPAARRAWRGALPWIVAGLSAAAAGAAILGPWRSRPVAPASSRTPLRFTVNEAEVRQRITPDLTSVAISRDGSIVCYCGAGPGVTMPPPFHATGVWDYLYVRRLSEIASVPLKFFDDNRGYDPIFSPDAGWVAFARQGLIFKIPVEGGQPVQLYAGQGLAKGYCWTERGIFVAPEPNSGLFLLPPDGGAPSTVTTPDPARGEVSHRWPDVLPDGRHVLFTVKHVDTSTFDDADIALLDLDSGTWKTLVKGGTFARYAPTGHLVFARAGSLLAVRFDAKTGQTSGTPTVMIEGVQTEPGSGAAQFAIARDTGTLVYVPGGSDEPKSELVWIELDGTTKPTGAPQRNYNWAAVSPDGKRVATGIWGASDQIFVYDLARGTWTRLTTKGNSSGPLWLRDGKRVGFTSDRDGSVAMYVANVDGTGDPERILDGSVGDQATCVTFEGGDALLYEKDRDLWVQPIRNRAPARPLFTTPYEEMHPRVSPDQRWIAYTSDETGQDEIYVRAFPSGEAKWQVSIGGGSLPFWLPGSDGVVFHTKDDLVVARAVEHDFSRARPERLASLPPDLRYFEMMPDGSRFLGIRNVPSTPGSGRVVAVVNWFTELEARLPRGG